MRGGLMDVAAELWPGSQVVPAQTAADDRPVHARFAVLRRNGAPHMLVPAEPSRAAAESIRRISAASSLREQATRSAVSALVRRAPVLLREQVEVRGGAGGLVDHLGELLGTQVSVSVSVGSARVNRKPVLQVFDAQGRSLAFAKIGWSAHTNADVAAEGQALRTLSGHDFRHLAHPAVLAQSSWLDHLVLVIEPLRPRPLVGAGHRWSPPLEAMEELAWLGAAGPGASGVEEGPLDRAPWWRRQWVQVGRLPDPVFRARMGRVLSRIEAAHGGRNVVCGAWHGDWTPWNMAAGRGGRVLVWDWERFETGVPVGLEPLHYALSAAHPGGPPSSAGLLRTLEWAAEADMRGASDPHLRELLYLVAVLVRYLSLTGVPGGEHIAPRAAVTLLALEELAAA
ncbi:hypothetical protein JK386_01445 [Nocardioides sp. zg-536]|uniref:Phosphotransferase n=1 Tax=Nocardioides faecalis TaxID=2803858 RepID=A0A939BRF2_9ACTN|nr:hypothetical protein [Nocardioides faecalis]MBM9458559.1 hypothetical protein [Nocardioides faecalis]QVI58561.1 hypothetical protein KG111_16535 [Nocardioides faecalis]